VIRMKPFTPMKMVESQPMHRSQYTPLVKSSAAVSLLAAVILMFVAIPAVLAQDADTTATVQDSTLMLNDPVLEEELSSDVIEADTSMVDSPELFDAIMDTTLQDSLTDESVMTETDSLQVEVMDIDSSAAYDPFALPPDPIFAAPDGMVWISPGKLPDPLRKFRDEDVQVAWSNGYYMDEHEVSNEEFANFLSSNFDNGIYFDERMYITEVVDGVFVADEGREDMPVTFVNWFGAFGYSQWAGKSLPTEEEWILACMGIYEDQDLTKWYPWGQADPETIQANLLDITTIGSPTPVMSYPSSMTSNGLYDMAGNVAEWTLTNFTMIKASDMTSSEDSEYENPTVVSQQVTESDSTTADSLNVPVTVQEESFDTSLRFVVKGGSYLDPPINMQLNRRSTRFPHERYQYVGFRCVRREGNR
jgi:formylglycine-generating enzyme required for sulfatase activity